MNPSDKSSQAFNPYRPSPEVEPASDPQLADTQSPDRPPISLTWTVIRWTLVCVIAASPSFFIGLDFTGRRYGGMIAGIATFICLYVAADLCTRHWPIRRNPSVRRTLVFVYVSRIAISIIFPAGLYLDLMTGAVMISFMNENREIFQSGPNLSSFNELAAFWTAYRMTMVQAVLMNILLSLWGLLAFPFIHLANRKG
jgi:hypothetical protein